MAGGVQVPLMEVGADSQAMDHIVGGLDSLHCRTKALRLQHVARHDLDGVVPGPPLQTRRISHQTTDAIAHLEKAWNQPPADVAGGAGHQDRAISRVFNGHLQQYRPLAGAAAEISRWQRLCRTVGGEGETRYDRYDRDEDRLQPLPHRNDGAEISRFRHPRRHAAVGAGGGGWETGTHPRV